MTPTPYVTGDDHVTRARSRLARDRCLTQSARYTRYPVTLHKAVATPLPVCHNLRDLVLRVKIAHPLHPVTMSILSLFGGGRQENMGSVILSPSRAVYGRRWSE